MDAEVVGDPFVAAAAATAAAAVPLCVEVPAVPGGQEVTGEEDDMMVGERCEEEGITHNGDCQGNDTSNVALNRVLSLSGLAR